MRLKEIKEKNFIPINAPYSNENWFLYLNDFLKSALISRYGMREILIDYDLYEMYFGGSYEEFKNVVSDDVKNAIDVLFKINNFKYKKLFYALNLEYNPIWNVDGTETLTYSRSNTGTQNISNSGTESQESEKNNTGTETTNHSNVNNIKSDNERNITETETINNDVTESDTKSNTGTQTNTTQYTGNESNDEMKNGNEIDSTVAFSSPSFRNHNKREYDGIETTNTKSFSNREDIETRTDNLNESISKTIGNDTDTERTHKDKYISDDTTNEYGNQTRTDNLKESYTNDVTKNDNTLRTDNLSELYSETKTRGGNIGTTKTQDLLESEYKLRNEMDFVGLVLSDIISNICYMSY